MPAVAKPATENNDDTRFYCYEHPMDQPGGWELSDLKPKWCIFHGPCKHQCHQAADDWHSSRSGAGRYLENARTDRATAVPKFRPKPAEPKPKRCEGTKTKNYSDRDYSEDLRAPNGPTS